MKIEVKKKLVNKNIKMRKSETTSSGGLTFSSHNHSDYCIESQLTKKKTHRFSLLSLESLYKKAIKLKKIPKLILGMEKDNGDMLFLDIDISLIKNNRKGK